MENILEVSYGRGLWQIIWCFLCNSLSFIEMFDFQSNLLMLYKPSSIKCISQKHHNSVNNTKEINYCNPSDLNFTSSKCSEWDNSDPMMTSNILIEQNLICDKEPIVNWLMMVYMLGIMFGQIMCMLTDIFGRRNLFLILITTRIVMKTLLILANETWMFFVLLFLRSLSFATTEICINQLVELVPLKKRAAFGHLCYLGWSVGYVMCPLLGYWLRSWRYVAYSSLIACALHPMFFYFFVESPRWLLLNGKVDEASNIFRKLIKVNNPSQIKTYENKLKKELVQVKEKLDSLEKNESICDALRSRQFLLKLGVQVFGKCSVNAGYYGVQIMTKFITDNIYFNIALLGLMEVPSTFVTVFTCEKIGRCKSALLFYCSSGLTLFILIFVQEFNYLKVVLGMLGKFLLSASSNINVSYSTEIFPTSLRNRACLITSISSFLCSAFTPFINSYLSVWASLLCYSIPITVNGIMVYGLLPETKGAPLSDSLADSKGFIKGRETAWTIHKLSKVNFDQHCKQEIVMDECTNKISVNQAST